MCHFPGMLPCWSGQCSGQCGQLVSQCYKPGDTAGHLHLRMAKKSKKGNPTPFTHGKEVQKRKFDSTKTMADKFKNWKYNSTMTYAICIYYIFRHLLSCKGNVYEHPQAALIIYMYSLQCLVGLFVIKVFTCTHWPRPPHAGLRTRTRMVGARYWNLPSPPCHYVIHSPLYSTNRRPIVAAVLATTIPVSCQWSLLLLWPLFAGGER